MVLRKYQEECLAAIKYHFETGATRAGIQMCTASGKTHVFCHLKQYLNLPGKVMVLAHRKELLTQAASKMKEANPNCTVSIDMGDLRPSGEDIIIGSVATLGRGNENVRRDAYDPNEFSLVILDEYHHYHMDNATYRRILNYFVEGNPQCKLIGFTATTERADGGDLSEMFGPIIFNYSIQRGMSEGYITNVIRAYSVSTNVDISSVKSLYGDFAINELSCALNIRERNDLILKSIQEHVEDRPTIIFACDVKHANSINDMLISSGYKSEVVTGETEQDERSGAIERYLSGKTQFLSSISVFSEGSDLPPTSCLCLARPTKSSLLLTQFVGRGLRLHGSKKDLLILDYVDNLGRNKIQTAVSLISGLNPLFNCEGLSISEVEQRVKKIAKINPNVDISRAKNFEEISVILNEIKDFLDFSDEDELLKLINFSWIKASDDSFLLSVGKEAFRIKSVDFGVYRGFNGFNPITEELSFYDVFKATDKYIRDNHKDQLSFVKRVAKWHERPPSSQQKHLLDVYEIPKNQYENMNRKEAQLLLSKLFLSNKYKIPLDKVHKIM